MRAAVHHRFGPPSVVQIEELPVPVPRADEVLVRVRATTVSAADRRARSKDVPAGLGLLSSLTLGFARPRHRVLGMDFAGVVHAVGSKVTGFRAGDEVIGMLGARFGAHAEFVVAPAAALARKPVAASFAEAAALVFGGITARAFLAHAHVGELSRVLVNGASGAVGTAAVQLAKAAGAEVTAVTSAGNEALARALGADHVIDYAAEDFSAGNTRYDIVMDCVGNAPVRRVGRVVAPGGAVLLVATDLRGLLSARHGRRDGLAVSASPGPYLASDLDHLVSLVDNGSLTPVIDRSYPLHQIAHAHAYVDTNRKRGAVVIDVA